MGRWSFERTHEYLHNLLEFQTRFCEFSSDYEISAAALFQAYSRHGRHVSITLRRRWLWGSEHVLNKHFKKVAGVSPELRSRTLGSLSKQLWFRGVRINESALSEALNQVPAQPPEPEQTPAPVIKPDQETYEVAIPEFSEEMDAGEAPILSFTMTAVPDTSGAARPGTVLYGAWLAAMEEDSRGRLRGPMLVKAWIPRRTLTLVDGKYPKRIQARLEIPGFQIDKLKSKKTP